MDNTFELNNELSNGNKRKKASSVKESALPPNNDFLAKSFGFEIILSSCRKRNQCKTFLI